MQHVLHTCRCVPAQYQVPTIVPNCPRMARPLRPLRSICIYMHILHAAPAAALRRRCAWCHGWPPPAGLGHTTPAASSAAPCHAAPHGARGLLWRLLLGPLWQGQLWAGAIAPAQVHAGGDSPAGERQQHGGCGQDAGGRCWGAAGAAGAAGKPGRASWAHCATRACPPGEVAIPGGPGRPRAGLPAGALLAAGVLRALPARAAAGRRGEGLQLLISARAMARQGLCCTQAQPQPFACCPPFAGRGRCMDADAGRVAAGSTRGARRPAKRMPASLASSETRWVQQRRSIVRAACGCPCRGARVGRAMGVCRAAWRVRGCAWWCAGVRV
jgi:hypothetical protein